jgi:gas vesicle protein
MTTGKAILGIMAGVATGVAMGMLFAPDKGENTRKKIVKKGEDLTQALNEKIDKKFNDLIRDIKDTMKSKPRNEKPETNKTEFAA